MRANVDWQRYATAYDLMAENNPAYQSLVAELLETVLDLGLRPGGAVADIGGGSGNLSVPLARRLPGSAVFHVDASPEMNAHAQAKARAAGLANHQIRTSDAWAAPFGPDSLSAVVTMHALYTLPRPKDYLKRVFTWVSPGGYLVACDAGRVINVLDWSLFLFSHSVHQRGWRQTIDLFRRGQPAASENRKIAREQRRGRYWTHTLAEFRAAIEAAGFEVLTARETYRGVSDLVVARKPERSLRSEADQANRGVDTLHR